MTSLEGHLLAATPRLQDPNFAHSVVLMIKHDEGGALGLIINRPMKMTLRDAWSQISDTPCAIDAPLHFGGPCEGPLMALHRDPEAGESEVLDGVYFTSDRDRLALLIEGAPTAGNENRDGKPAIKCFVGYAGWAPSQLEEELAIGSWVAVPASLEDVFHGPPDQWSRTIESAWGVRNLRPQIVPPDPTVN